MRSLLCEWASSEAAADLRRVTMDGEAETGQIEASQARQSKERLKGIMVWVVY